MSVLDRLSGTSGAWKARRMSRRGGRPRAMIRNREERSMARIRFQILAY